jgi:hypothetical protein
MDRPCDASDPPVSILPRSRAAAFLGTPEFASRMSMPRSGENRETGDCRPGAVVGVDQHAQGRGADLPAEVETGVDKLGGSLRPVDVDVLRPGFAMSIIEAF